MNGPTGFNVRYRKGRGHAEVTLRVSPSTLHNAMQVADALDAAGMSFVEVWRSGKGLKFLHQRIDLNEGRN